MKTDRRFFMKSTVIKSFLSVFLLVAINAQAQESESKNRENSEQRALSKIDETIGEKNDVETRYYLDSNQLMYQTGETESVAVDVAATPLALFTSDNKAYVALGKSGVQIFSPDESGVPVSIVKIPSPGGVVVGFFKVDGIVWMQLQSTKAIPLDGEVAFASISPSSSVTIQTEKIESTKKNDVVKSKNKISTDVSSSAEQKQYKIVDFYPGEARIDGGTKNGVSIGDSFDVYRNMTVQRKHLGEYDAREKVAYVVVTAVNDDSAIVMLGRGDRVKKGDLVLVAQKNDDKGNVFPRKFSGIGEVEIVVRPLLNVSGSNGFGGLIDASGSYYWKNAFATLRIHPMGFGWTDSGNVVSSSMAVEGGYDGRAFAIGLGAGVALVNGDMDGMIGDSYWQYDADQETTDTSSKAAFALTQSVRLGARDGLNMHVYNSFIYYNDSTFSTNSEDDSGFIYGGTTGKINIPLGNRINLFMRGGGGRMGYGFGELGIFAWLRGNGDAGSIGISGAAGGAKIWMEKSVLSQNANYYDTQQISIAGPLVSLGFVYRFGSTPD